MLRYKQFAGQSAQLELPINLWLSEFEPDVTQMTQTVTPDGNIVISFLFEESFRGQEIRLSHEHNLTQATVPAVPPEVAPDEPVHVESDGGMAPP